MATRNAYSPGTPPIWHGMARVQKVAGGVVPILTTDLTLNGTVGMFVIPAGLTVDGFSLDTAQLHSGTTLTVSIGTAAVPGLFLLNSTAFRAATAGVPAVFGARGTKFLVDTPVFFVATAAATTPVAGNVTCYVLGFIDP